MLNDDWTKFQVDLAYKIANADEPQNGAALKERLRREYDEAINHGRLYPNLGTLVERGIVEKYAVDNRENHYVLTDAGRERLEEDLEARDFR